MSASNRRDFLRAFGLRAARGAQEIAETASPLLRATSPAGLLSSRDDEAVPAAVAEKPARPAAPPRPAAARPSCCVSPEELRELLVGEGLERRGDEVVALARRSLRMTPADADADAARVWINLDDKLGGDPLDGLSEQVVLALVAADAPVLAGTPLHGDGWLVYFVAPGSAEPADSELPVQIKAPPMSVEVVRLDEPVALTPTMAPMELTPQLVLPRVWNEAVQALGLDAGERDAYVRMRDRLAEEQGVEIEHGAGNALAYHRLFGYPDETSGLLPAECAAVSGEGDWNLLMQVSAGPSRRVYVLGEGDGFERPVALVR